MSDILGHPRGLFVLFFAEMWERFSFYGMRALLIFYLTQHFLFDDAASAGIYASYGALVYLMPVLGGMLADRYLGFRKAVTFGAILLALGHLGMALEGEPAREVGGAIVRDAVSIQTFYLSIALIIVGVGFLKPSISSIVGRLYSASDPRRDSGFTIFYMGINLGAFTAALACGYLGQTYGWRYGFGLAGVGMLVGLATFVRGRHLLQGAGEPRDPQRLRERIAGGLTREYAVYLCSLLAVVVVWQLVQWHVGVGGVLVVVGGGVSLWIIWFSLARCDKVERARMLLMLFLTAMSVVFWAFFEQAGSSMNLFTDRNVDRELFGVTLQASQFQSFNPAFIILLAPLFSALWVKLDRWRMEPGTPAKFGLGIVQVGLGFAVLVYGASLVGDDFKVAPGWLVLAYLLHTTGELCLSPVGLSMITRLSVARVTGMMMGVWFLSSAFSQYVGGLIAAGASVKTHGGEVVDPAAALATYTDTFGYLAIVALGVGVALLLISPRLRRFMHEDHESRISIPSQ